MAEQTDAGGEDEADGAFPSQAAAHGPDGDAALKDDAAPDHGADDSEEAHSTDAWDDGTSNAGSHLQDCAEVQTDEEAEDGIDLAIWWQMVEDWESEVEEWSGRVDDLGERVEALRDTLLAMEQEDQVAETEQGRGDGGEQGPESEETQQPGDGAGEEMEHGHQAKDGS